MPHSVYLIVAGVLLGPIHSQVLHPGYAECRAERPIPLGQMIPDNDPCLKIYNERSHFESTAETCERAMREIGATKTFDGWRVREFPEQWGIDGQPVLCIPAPSGLRKP